MEIIVYNIGKVIKVVGQTTLETLNQFEIPFDELYFGKPWADIYIDDKAFNTFDKNLFEQIGFFDNSIYILINSSSTVCGISITILGIPNILHICLTKLVLPIPVSPPIINRFCSPDPTLDIM